MNGILGTVAGFVGKALNSGAFYIVYMHTAEIFPTLARNTCLSLSSAAGRLGSIAAPYIAYMSKYCGLVMLCYKKASISLLRLLYIVYFCVRIRTFSL